MCGITAYVGCQSAQPILLGGLRRLEYRGYDSSGIAELHGNKLRVTKAAGRIAELESQLPKPAGTIGIAHTRWATHGQPTAANAHPHLAADGSLALVHNGIIENYQQLRDRLQADGVTFAGETDSEVLGHLIASYLPARANANQFRDAVRRALQDVFGTFGLVVISSRFPDTLIAARRGSPLAIGYGAGEKLVASDASALVEHTKQIVYLEDDELAMITPADVRIETLASEPVERTAETIEFGVAAIEKGGYDHFMLKEIHEQPESLRDVFRGRLDPEQGTAHLGGLNLSDAELREIKQIVLIGCGTAYYAALTGEYWFEQLTKLPTIAAVASEWRYRQPVIDQHTLCVVVSQSGETADTLAALREAQAKGAKTLGLVNVVGSTIAREAAGGVYLHAGPEIGVASSKAYTNMLGALMLLALKLGRLRTLSVFDGQRICQGLAVLPNQLAHQLEQEAAVRPVAERFTKTEDALYLGRGSAYPAALEGSHKLKEISYVHSEAYPGGEMKHGANALIEPKLLVMFLIPQNALYAKSRSNLEEVRAREGTVVAITTEGNLELKGLADHVLYIPVAPELLDPFLLTIPQQLFAYHMAVSRGTDVDKPRNLAKSVTVE